MYCENCGKQRFAEAKFCRFCGQKFDFVTIAGSSTQASLSGIAADSRTKSLDSPQTSQVLKFAIDERNLGTRWLKYWTYVHLPFTGVFGIGLGLLIASQNMELGIVVIAICAPYIATSIGLHTRRSWGWRLNWLTIALNSVNGLVPNSYETIGDPVTSRVAGEFTARLILVSLFWVLPNLIYWRKRRHLFS